jgi:hypothetical protein
MDIDKEEEEKKGEVIVSDINVCSVYWARRNDDLRIQIKKRMSSKKSHFPTFSHHTGSFFCHVPTTTQQNPQQTINHIQHTHTHTHTHKVSQNI